MLAATAAAIPVLAFGLAPAAIPLTAGAAPPAIGFEVPRVADPLHMYGEPDILVNPRADSNVYVSGPTGTGTQRSIWQGSVDGGHTFRNISRVVTDQTPGCTIAPVCGPLAAPGGGDTEITFDGNGKQFFADLYALACQHVATRTTNASGQETVAESAAGGCPVPGSDRQWMVVRDPSFPEGPPVGLSPLVAGAHPAATVRPHVVYMESNTVAQCSGNGGAGWYQTQDGLTYSAAQVDGQSGFPLVQDYCPFGADGYPAIDQQTGTVFQAQPGTVSDADTTPAMKLNIGTPGLLAADLNKLCFLDAPAASTTCPGKGTSTMDRLVNVASDNTTTHPVAEDSSEAANFTVASMDRGRNLWVTWVGRSNTPELRQVWTAVASASSNWRTFSAPIKVSSPPSMASIFPWVQAGGPGRADVVWYGEDKAADPSSKSGQAWNVFMSQVVFPVDESNNITVTATPTVTQTKVTPHPMDYNDVCLQGTACIASVGNRNLADFFQLRIDGTGAAMIVYNDLSNGLCQLCPGSVEGAAHIGAPVVTIARQSSGPGLFSDQTVTGPSNAPVPGLATTPGRALFPMFGGTPVPGLDVFDSHLGSAGDKVTVKMTVGGPVNDPAATATAAGCPTCQLQYVTRWQMGNDIYYAMMTTGPQGGQSYYAGKTVTIDDCSVSACDPHMMIYPDLGPTAHGETGTLECPTNVPATAAVPCVITINVLVGDIGNPTNSSLLEEVGAYGLKSSVPQSLITQAMERADTGATEIGGVCCYNFGVAGIVAPSPTPVSGGGDNGGLPDTATGFSVGGFAGLGVLAVAGVLAESQRRRRRRPRIS
jgi:hypothetical protein